MQRFLIACFTTAFAFALLGNPHISRAQEGIEQLTRGPLHEAFAEPVTFDNAAQLIAPQEPPPPIEEVPPEYRPDDEEAVWIGGYWAWDEDRADFLWISGVWRVPPPGQRWIAGRWQPAGDGWQWIAGFWISVETAELTYRPEPPESLEAGPSGPAPSDNHFYIPGVWQYTAAGYRWQPGHWHECYENWIWVPARWIWTPRGVIFANGYFDYRVPQRGCVFAPVYFTQAVYSQPQFVYRPTIVLNTNLFVDHLFVRPGYHHYYFGDYYGDRYARQNIVPAYAWHTRRGGYDPVVSFYAADYRRRGEDYLAFSKDRYTNYVRHEDRRPAHTYHEAQQRIDRVENPQDRQADQLTAIASRLNDVAKEKRHDHSSFVRLEERQSREIQEHNKQNRDLARQRDQVERTADRPPVGRDRDDVRPIGQLTLPKIVTNEPRPTTDKPQLPRNRPGRDDVPRPIARTNQPEDSPQRGDDPPQRPEFGVRPGIGNRPEIGKRPGAEKPEVERKPMTDPIPPGRERPQIGNRPELPGREPGATATEPREPRERDMPKTDRPVGIPPKVDRPNLDLRNGPRPGNEGTDKPRPTERPGLNLPGGRDPREAVDTGAAQRATAEKAAAEKAAAERAAAERMKATREAAERAAREKKQPEPQPQRNLRPEIPAPNRGAGNPAADGAKAAQEAQQRAAQEQAQKAQRDQQQRTAQQQAERAAQAQRAAQEQAQKAQRDQQRAAEANRPPPQPRPVPGNPSPGNPPGKPPGNPDKKDRDKK